MGKLKRFASLEVPQKTLNFLQRSILTKSKRKRSGKIRDNGGDLFFQTLYFLQLKWKSRKQLGREWEQLISLTAYRLHQWACLRSMCVGFNYLVWHKIIIIQVDGLLFWKSLSGSWVDKSSIPLQLALWSSISCSWRCYRNPKSAARWWRGL